MKVLTALSMLVISLALVSSQEEMTFLGEQMMMSHEMASPVQLTNEEYEEFKAFLLANAEDPEPSDVNPSPVDPDPKPKPSTMDNLIGSFMKLTNGWGQIVNAFKTTRTSTLKQTILGKGFDYFNQSAQIQISTGIKDEFFDKYLGHLETRIKVPKDRQEDLKMVLEECRWAEKNVWSATNTLYSIDDGGNVKFVSILAARNDEKNTFDFVFSDIKAEFKLAPDVMIINKKLSVLGGIWEDDKDVEVKVPKSITPEDLKMVMSFFQIVAFKSFADQFGIQLDFPKL